MTNPWTLCSCRHLAQDHSEDLKCEWPGCKCVKYDGEKKPYSAVGNPAFITESEKQGKIEGETSFLPHLSRLNKHRGF